jgi:lipopolysaccharide export system ATP-binding protein
MTNVKKFRVVSYKKDNFALKLENISLKFGKLVVLDNLNLVLNSGQILGLLGSNGAGKSTIFNLIIGLIKPNTGIIKINSFIVNKFPIYERALKFKIGFVPQVGGFFHDLTIYENFKAISEVNIIEKNLREEKINYLLSKFELDNIKNTKSKLLSGGQKKKLVIALALISDPKILLLDEPFAALDVMTIKMLQNIIVDLQSSKGISIILCDHQARDLLNCVDEAAIISEGKVIAYGSPSNLTQNIKAKNAYFGDSFKFN